MPRNACKYRRSADFKEAFAPEKDLSLNQVISNPVAAMFEISFSFFQGFPPPVPTRNGTKLFEAALARSLEKYELSVLRNEMDHSKNIRGMLMDKRGISLHI